MNYDFPPLESRAALEGPFVQRCSRIAASRHLRQNWAIAACPLAAPGCRGEGGGTSQKFGHGDFARPASVVSQERLDGFGDFVPHAGEQTSPTLCVVDLHRVGFACEVRLALAAQAYGAREPRMVRRSLRMGLWAAVILGVPINVIQLWGEDILLAVGQTPEAAVLAARYLTGLAWSMIPAWCFIALRNFMGAVNRPEPALWITLVAIPINALLAYALIHGYYGLPRLDLLGAGLATAFVNVAMCIAAVWVCYACRPFKKYRILGRFWRADWPLFGRLLAIGAPEIALMAVELALGLVDLGAFDAENGAPAAVRPPHVDAHEIAAAHEAAESGALTGKVVVSIGG